MSLFMSIILALVAGAAYISRRIGGDAQLERPIVVCPLVGLLLGDLTTGVQIGGSFELIFIGAAPIGGAVPPNVVLAAVLGTAVAITSGQGVETAFLIGVPAAVVATGFELLAKSGCSFLVHRADTYAQANDSRGISRIMWIGNAIHFFAYAIPAFVGLYLGQALIEDLQTIVSQPVQDGLNVAGVLLPAVGFGILLNVLAARAVFPLFFVGFVLAAYAGFTVIGVAILGVALLVVYHLSREEERETAEAPADHTGGDK